MALQSPRRSLIGGLPLVLSVLGLVLALAVGGYWHFSPYLAMQSMKQSAQAKDAETFNSYVDYPKLRESLKGQLAGLMTEQARQAKGTGSPFQGAGAALALAFINPLIDSMVNPEFVMRAMSQGDLSSNAPAPAKPADDKPDVTWDVEREGVSKVLAHAHDPAHPGEVKFSAVFERTGFADWKLTAVRLPVELAL